MQEKNQSRLRRKSRTVLEFGWLELGRQVFKCRWERGQGWKLVQSSAAGLHRRNVRW